MGSRRRVKTLNQQHRHPDFVQYVKILYVGIPMKEKESPNLSLDAQRWGFFLPPFLFSFLVFFFFAGSLDVLGYLLRYSVGNKVDTACGEPPAYTFHSVRTGRLVFLSWGFASLLGSGLQSLELVSWWALRLLPAFMTAVAAIPRSGVT